MYLGYVIAKRPVSYQLGKTTGNWLPAVDVDIFCLGKMMKFIDLQAQYDLCKPQIDAAIAGVLHHGQYLFGPEIAVFENQLAAFVGVKHCIACSSGTMALQIALMALDVQPGDEVITTPFSFFATAEVIYLLGATPVYVDIEPDTYLIDPAKIEAVITSKTKAIVPVSLYGQCANMDAINQVAGAHGIAVIEDAAQSLGATYQQKRSCGLSDIACTSFFPSKPLGGYGDSGACFTNDDALASRLRSIINHGQESRYHHVMLGLNGRMDSIQAAVLIEKFALFQNEIKQREQVASWYRLQLPEGIRPPVIAPGNTSVYAQYTIEVDNREAVQHALTERGIPTAVHYPIGLHKQPVVARLHKGKMPDFPVTDRVASRVLSLPFYPYMPESSVKEVCEQLRDVLTFC